MKNTVYKAKPSSAMTLKALALTVAMTAASQSHAADFMRTVQPVIAGTQIHTELGTCTVGLILKGSGFLSNVTAYQKAVRYGVTAGHCVKNMKSDVRVGDTSVGKFVWKSQETDLALFRIEPVAKRYTHCTAPSTGLNCSINYVYEPRALGNIFLGSLRSRSLSAVPVIGTGSPGRNEVFCTSGSNSGVICAWGVLPPNVAFAQPSGHEQIAESYTATVLPTDSGGPVSSSSGVVYGIIVAMGNKNTSSETRMNYVPIQEFFKEQKAYELAPSK